MNFRIYLKIRASSRFAKRFVSKNSVVQKSGAAAAANGQHFFPVAAAVMAGGGDSFNAGGGETTQGLEMTSRRTRSLLFRRGDNYTLRPVLRANTSRQRHLSARAAGISPPPQMQQQQLEEEESFIQVEVNGHAAKTADDSRPAVSPLSLPMRSSARRTKSLRSTRGAASMDDPPTAMTHLETPPLSATPSFSLHRSPSSATTTTTTGQQTTGGTDHKHHQQGLTPQPSVMSHGSSSTTRYIRKRREKSTVILVSIVLIFLLCHTYRLILRVWEISNPGSMTAETFRECSRRGLYNIPMAFILFVSAHHLLLVINSSVNFIIYCCVGREFRSQVYRCCTTDAE